ncbi:MAG: DUF4870 domain-containing protein [Pyrinomonadaceae bacterium]|nr:DUF4870 domain-containing protein [Pyrinomonadaceae bacterium]
MNEMQHQPGMSLQTQEERQMGMFLHLSQLANVVLPPAGIVLPIVIWQIKKEEMPALDAHGKMAVNWLISSFIYIIISLPLMLLLIGFFTAIAVGICGMVFPIIAAVKANNGEFWEYPLTIKFLK